MTTSTHEPLHVIAATSADDGGKDFICFQYPWTLRICERKLENSEAAVLNVSPPFTTAYNGVQFTWALRLSDECVVTPSDTSTAAHHVFLHLYYKDGPCADVNVEDVKAAVYDMDNKELFRDLHCGAKEFTKGSGWPVPPEKSTAAEFTKFVQGHIGTQINILITMRLRTSLFEPFNYLPDVETSQRIEKHCLKFIDNVRQKTVHVPNLDLIDGTVDKYAMHRMIFLHGCDLVEQWCVDEKGPNPPEHFFGLIKSTFAHVYFKYVLMKEVEFFDDFITLLEGIIQAHIPPLRREIERFMCGEVMDTTDNEFTKRILLLAERFSLDVLKMVAAGVLVDQIIGHSNPPAELVSISHDLQKFASEMNEISSHQSQPPEDVLVESVVEDLQALTRRVRRVSLSHSPSVSSQLTTEEEPRTPGSSPSATPSDSVSLSPSVSDQRPFDSQSRFKRVELA